MLNVDSVRADYQQTLARQSSVAESVTAMLDARKRRARSHARRKSNGFPRRTSTWWYAHCEVFRNGG